MQELRNWSTHTRVLRQLDWNLCSLSCCLNKTLELDILLDNKATSWSRELKSRLATKQPSLVRLEICTSLWANVKKRPLFSSLWWNSTHCNKWTPSSQKEGLSVHLHSVWLLWKINESWIFSPAKFTLFTITLRRREYRWALFMKEHFKKFKNFIPMHPPMNFSLKWTTPPQRSSKSNWQSAKPIKSGKSKYLVVALNCHPVIMKWHCYWLGSSVWPRISLYLKANSSRSIFVRDGRIPTGSFW